MLSVIIIAKNEQERIRKCLASISFADEIIVLDSGSSDNTVNIAREYTTHVYETDWQGYGIQKQRALTYANEKWVLNLDADEFIDEALRDEIINKITSEKADAYRIPIRMNFYGQSLKYSSSPSRHIRLFRREGARYSDDIVHEKIVLPQNFHIEQINNPIQHNSYHDLSHALYKLNRYSSYSAKTRIAQGKKPSYAKTVLGSIWMFIRCYILQRGFLDGKAGFIYAILNAQGTFFRGMKQIYKDSNLETLPNTLETEETVGTDRKI